MRETTVETTTRNSDKQFRQEWAGTLETASCRSIGDSCVAGETPTSDKRRIGRPWVQRPEKRRECSACGRTFVSRKTRQGRWPKTCSVECQIRALDKLIDALVAKKAALVAEGGGL